jgi:hypothetical protein
MKDISLCILVGLAIWMLIPGLQALVRPLVGLGKHPCWDDMSDREIIECGIFSCVGGAILVYAASWVAAS